MAMIQQILNKMFFPTSSGNVETAFNLLFSS